jgi:hypothetical protein
MERTRSWVSSNLLPSCVFCENVQVAAPNELDIVFDTWALGMLILIDTQLEPCPSSSVRVVTEALVMGLGKELDIVDAFDSD